MAYSFSFQRIEVTTIFIRIFETKFEIVGFPPRGRNVDIALCSGNDELTLRFYSSSDLNGGSGSRETEVYLCEAVIFQGFILK